MKIFPNQWHVPQVKWVLRWSYLAGYGTANSSHADIFNYYMCSIIDKFSLVFN